MGVLLPAGHLRQVVTIQRVTTAPDDSGEPIETWADLATRRAKIQQINGTESVVAAQLRADADYIITIRGRIEITPQDRILYKGRVINIIGIVDTDEMGVQYVITGRSANI